MNLLMIYEKTNIYYSVHIIMLTNYYFSLFLKCGLAEELISFSMNEQYILSIFTKDFIQLYSREFISTYIIVPS